jgi:hypothetical protein
MIYHVRVHMYANTCVHTHTYKHSHMHLDNLIMRTYVRTNARIHVYIHTNKLTWTLRIQSHSSLTSELLYMEIRSWCIMCVLLSTNRCMYSHTHTHTDTHLEVGSMQQLDKQASFFQNGLKMLFYIYTPSFHRHNWRDVFLCVHVYIYIYIYIYI